MVAQAGYREWRRSNQNKQGNSHWVEDQQSVCLPNLPGFLSQHSALHFVLCYSSKAIDTVTALKENIHIVLPPGYLGPNQ